MDHLLAKIKGKKGGLAKVISNEKIFNLPADLDSSVAYDPAYKLEEDEWFSIPKFSKQDYCIDFLTKKFVSTDFEQIPVDKYDKIKYLCAYQTNTYFFQKLSASQLIKKKYLSLSNAPKLIENEPIIVISKYADAVYIKDEDTIYFKNLASIATIFKGIVKLYREATQKETETFLKNDFIK